MAIMRCMLDNSNIELLDSLFREQSALGDTVDQASVDRSNAICRWTDWIGLVAHERYTNMQNSTNLTLR